MHIRRPTGGGLELEGKGRRSEKTSRTMGHLGWALKCKEEFSRQRQKDHVGAETAQAKIWSVWLLGLGCTQESGTAEV